MSYKIVINNSGQDLTVSLLTRQGSDPVHSGETISQYIENKGSYRFQYGNDENPFLNGVTIAWQNNDSNASQAENVTVRGGAWDNTLNTNDTLTISGATTPAITGSNS